MDLPLGVNKLFFCVCSVYVFCGRNNSLVQFETLVGQGVHPIGLELLLLLGSEGQFGNFGGILAAQVLVATD